MESRAGFSFIIQMVHFTYNISAQNDDQLVSSWQVGKQKQQLRLDQVVRC